MADNSNPNDGSTYIPADKIIPGNCTPYSPSANNPLRDTYDNPVPTPVGR